VKIEKHLSTTPFTGTTKGTVVNLKPGKWKYYCSVHESQMFGSSKSRGRTTSHAAAFGRPPYFGYVYLILPSATSSRAMVK
jgi:hypothetical protein